MLLSISRANKKGFYHAVKALSFYDSETNMICICQLNINATLRKHEGAAEAVDCSLQKIDINGIKVNLFSCATNAGGSCISIRLVDQLQKFNCRSSNFLHATYSLHALNLIVSSRVNKCIDQDGNQLRVLLQMLCTYYAAQDEYELVELKNAE